MSIPAANAIATAVRPPTPGSLPRTVRIDRRLMLRLAALFALVGGLVVAWLGSTYYRLESHNQIALQRADQEHVLGLVDLAAREALANVMSDLRLFSRDLELLNYLAHPGAAAQVALEKEFATLVTQKREYDQVRLLGPDGRERLRVNRTDDGAAIAPAAALQDKSRRYYFNTLRTLAPGEIYVSPLDLNEENGQVERPLKPMIRLGLAIQDASGARHGYLLFNYRAEALLNRLRGQVAKGQALWLLDERGEWLLGPSSEDAWSGQLPERRERGFARRQATHWAELQSRESGSLELAAGWVRFQHLHPLRSPAGAEAAPQPSRVRAADSYTWYALITPPPRPPRAAALDSLAFKGGLVLALLVLAGATTLAYAIARQRALARSLEQAVDNVPVLIAYIDGDGCFRFNNRAFLDTYGVTPKALYGTHLRELLGEDGYREAHPHLQQALAGDRAEFELFLESGSGPRDLGITFVPDGSPPAQGVYALMSDITQRRLAERREWEHQREMAQVARLASVGEITSEIAHQMNQPLAAIAMFSNAAQRTLDKGGGQGDSGKLRDWMETINAQAKRASDVVARLRRFAHQGEIHSAPLDLNDSVREAVAMLEGDARSRQVPMEMALAESLPEVFAASVLMEQVLYNLLHNAIRSAARQDPVGKVTIRSHADADRVWVGVFDGEPEPEPPALTDAPGDETKGFGVDLSISRSIVRSYDGDIICGHNKVGGSQVLFFLPRLQA